MRKQNDSTLKVASFVPPELEVIVYVKSGAIVSSWHSTLTIVRSTLRGKGAEISDVRLARVEVANDVQGKNRQRNKYP